MMTEQNVHELRSPLAQPGIETIWVRAAAVVGWRVTRQSAAFASTDGQGNMLIGVDEILDAGDAAAQLIFHELCHGLVEGPARWSAPDWGLSNSDGRDTAHEHACLRLQVHLSERHGLRELMAPTTEYRAYHDQIAGDPLHDENDPAAALARAAIERPASRAWIDVLGRALSDTRAVLDLSATDAARDAAGAALHPVGFLFANSSTPGQSCGTCAWIYRGGRGRPVERCRQSAPGGDGIGRRTAAHYRACARWEPQVDCQTCGACCREAYHSVTISMRDPVVWKHPQLVVRNGHRFEVLRAGPRCAALHEEQSPPAADVTAGEPSSTPSPSSTEIASALAPSLAPAAAPLGTATTARAFSCAIYQDRPRPCREFEAGGRHCLVARRRVGLTP